jgi:putative transcriptional regulator
MHGRLIAICLLAGVLLSAQDPGRLTPGSFLVASRDLRDPGFAQTVILLIDHGRKGSMGLVINRRSRLHIDRLADDLRGSADRKDPLYLGGPVSQTGVVALLRTPTAPEDAKPVFQDVYLLSLKDQIEDTLTAGNGRETFRIYLGYSGWGPGQLAFEQEHKSWHIFPADAAQVFDPHPETLWSRLIRKTEMRFAAVPLAPGGYNRSLLPLRKH